MTDRAKVFFASLQQNLADAQANLVAMADLINVDIEGSLHHPVQAVYKVVTRTIRDVTVMSRHPDFQKEESVESKTETSSM